MQAINIHMSDPDLISRVKSMLVDSLMLKVTPEQIGDDTLLFSPEGLALDSIDALELAVAIEKKFGVATPSAEVAREAFVSVNTIAAYITAKSAKP
jgi:acyl carrier protein